MRSNATRSVALVVLSLAAALTVPASAGAVVSIGQSGWYWGNPLPQGQTLRAIQFSGARGYAVGDFGAVIRTDDGGTTWSGLPSGTEEDLRAVQVLGPDIVIVAGGCSARRSNNGGASFAFLPVTNSETDCTDAISDFSFGSATAGFFTVGGNEVSATTDGGQSFSARTSVPGGGGDAKLFALDANTVVAVRGNGIFRTVNAAGNWTQVATASAQLNDVTFISPTVGYAVGNGGLVMRTSDGGASWTPGSVANGNPNLGTVSCGGPTLCLAAASDGSRVLRTTDGTTFTSLAVSSSPIFAAAFSSATRAVAVGADGATAASNDGGATFTPVGGGVVIHREDDPLTILRQGASPSTAYALGGAGRIARTTNSGQSWQLLTPPGSANLIDVSFPTATVGFALDSGGRLRKTTNGGGSWSTLNTGTTRAPRAVIAPDINTVLLIGPRGVRRSSDGGGSFAAVADSDVSNASISDVDRAGSAIVASGGRVIVVSTNRGRSWTTIALPSRQRLRDLDMVSASQGWALDRAGYLFSTRNGGRKWTESLGLGVGASRAYDIAFGSLSKGYVTTNALSTVTEARGIVLRTSDGGRTFRPQVLNQIDLDDVLATSGGVDYAAFFNRLFATTTGGDQGVRSRITLSTANRTVRRGQRIKVQGRLTPPQGDERILVSQRTGGRWTAQTVTAAANGSFTATFRVSNNSVFVAQWEGDDDRNAAGSKTLTVNAR